MIAVPIHLVRPAGVDDPGRPSGGNVYDRRLADALGAVEHTTTATVPDGALALVDGLLTSADTVAEARRLRLVVLVHLPREEPWEGELLRAAAAVVTTSRWTRRRLVAAHDLDGARVFVAEPGVDAAPLAPGTPGGGRLLCVGAVSALKGHDVLAAALTRLADLDWTCRVVGSTAVEPVFAAALAGSLDLTGPLDRPALAAAYAEADLVVVPSRVETYGMVVTEALARGLPVVASDVGGVHEALGRRGGVLVPAGDPRALADALRRWLTDPGHRARLRAGARARRPELRGWDYTVTLVGAALRQVGGEAAA